MDEDEAKALLRQEGSLAGMVLIVGVVAIALYFSGYIPPLMAAGFFLLAAGVASAMSAQAYKKRAEEMEAGEEQDEVVAQIVSTVKARNIMAGYGVIAGTALLTLGFLLG